MFLVSDTQEQTMNTFYEHHQSSINFAYRCFDRILLNGLIQPFQQPERVIGFFNAYRNAERVTRNCLRDIAQQFQNWLKNRCEKWGVPVLDAPEGRRDDFVDPYFKRAKTDEVVVILKAREPARMMIAIGSEDRWHLQMAQRWVMQYNFYINDQRWGRMFVRMCPYLPFSARVCLNQHHWLAKRMREEEIDFQQCSNAFLITHYPQPSSHGTKQEHTAVSAGLNDGAQQGAISKGAQRGPVCCSLRNRGSVPGGGDALALAIRLCLPGLRRAASQLPQDPGALPVYRLSTADIGDRRNDFRSDQGAAVHLVSRHVPSHSEQGRHLQHRVGPPAWRHPDHRLEDQAQADAGGDGAGRHKAPDGTDRNRRRLSRRGLQRGQAGPRFAWEDADRGGGANHTRGQANLPEVAPREGFPPCRNRDLGAAQFPSLQHRRQ